MCAPSRQTYSPANFFPPNFFPIDEQQLSRGHGLAVVHLGAEAAAPFTSDLVLLICRRPHSIFLRRVRHACRTRPAHNAPEATRRSQNADAPIRNGRGRLAHISLPGIAGLDIAALRGSGRSDGGVCRRVGVHRPSMCVVVGASDMARDVVSRPSGGGVCTNAGQENESELV